MAVRSTLITVPHSVRPMCSRIPYRPLQQSFPGLPVPRPSFGSAVFGEGFGGGRQVLTGVEEVERTAVAGESFGRGVPNTRGPVVEHTAVTTQGGSAAAWGERVRPAAEAVDGGVYVRVVGRGSGG